MNTMGMMMLNMFMGKMLGRNTFIGGIRNVGAGLEVSTVLRTHEGPTLPPQCCYLLSWPLPMPRNHAMGLQMTDCRRGLHMTIIGRMGKKIGPSKEIGIRRPDGFKPWKQ
jgi:hypothetical protein